MFKIDISSLLFKNILLYGAWITFHYLAGHLYTYICIPKTITGFLLSPFVVASPQCIAIRWVITKSGDNICMMWMVLGNLCITQIDIVSNYAKNKT